jgi:hypothetical protein
MSCLMVKGGGNKGARLLYAAKPFTSSSCVPVVVGANKYGRYRVQHVIGGDVTDLYLEISSIIDQARSSLGS